MDKAVHIVSRKTPSEEYERKGEFAIPFFYQALNALVFLCKQMLKIELGDFSLPTSS